MFLPNAPVSVLLRVRDGNLRLEAKRLQGCIHALKKGDRGGLN